MNGEGMTLYNGQSVARSTVPVVDFDRFCQTILSALAGEAHLSALFGAPQGDAVRLFAVVSDTASGHLVLTSTDVRGRFPSMTRTLPQAHLFEREIFERWGVLPEGHPWLKPVRRPPRTGGPAQGAGDGAFFRMEGEDVHEVAVGPVHAGVIEPGHFRFSCHGETVHHLEISLGYQHRGVERALAGGPDARTIHYMETLAGDASVGHAVAYCRTIESLADRSVAVWANVIRAIASELERLANHIGCLGALAGDVGYLPTRNFCGRIRGDALNMTALMCGSRFGRGLVVPGGAAADMGPSRTSEMLRRLDALEKDSGVAVSLLFDAPSALARFEGVGAVSEQIAREIGMVGVAARASGLPRDVRSQLPYGIYRYAAIPMSTYTTGDCFARAYVRWLEVVRSIAFVREQVHSLAAPSPPADLPAIGPDRLVATVVEGFRGEICHVAATDAGGRFAFYKVVDPSFHNWFGLACAMRGGQVSDFPLCNKSFDLSYCGHDL